MIEINPEANYIFNAVTIDSGYSPESLFDGWPEALGLTLLVFEDNSIYLERVATDEDIKRAKFVIFGGKNYTIAPNKTAVSPLITGELLEILANSQYSYLLEEVELG
jgi:hypothetical protein